eukprot:TRINITY_DN41079_c0_g2_i1.p1 TRINITY_DN41079_c0_g2~~TRINITY_DN41079_c0_g2_i1.p1  ORF type:complete len:161 (-),score=44.75 TRINITY_DN41079_c0_g2_i1:81-563(-)
MVEPGKKPTKAQSSQVAVSDDKQLAAAAGRLRTACRQLLVVEETHLQASAGGLGRALDSSKPSKSESAFLKAWHKTKGALPPPPSAASSGRAQQGKRKRPADGSSQDLGSTASLQSPRAKSGAKRQAGAPAPARTMPRGTRVPGLGNAEAVWGFIASQPT